MKKIVLLCIVGLTTLMSIEFTMSKSGLYPNVETQTPTTPVITAPPSNSNWVEAPLPTKSFNVLNYGLKGDGVTDDSAALNNLAANTSVTNWYFPSGYTFLLYSVSVPEHVKVVHGTGTIKVLTPSGVGTPDGAIYQNTDHTGYLVDGLTFIDDGGTGSTYTGGSGMITISGVKEAHNIEIRNCTFDGTNSPLWQYSRNAMGVYGNPDIGHTSNIWIHHNTFINIKGAGMEILQRGSIDPDGLLEGIKDIRVNNNTFNGEGWCAVSISQVRNSVMIENNTFNNWRWDVEINQAKNVTFRYNKCTNTREEFVSNGGTGWHTPEYDDINSPNINWVYNNHFESPTGMIYMYGGSSTDYHDNYIKGGVTVDGRSGNGDGGRVFNNTIVTDGGIIGGPGLYLYNLNVVTYDGHDFSNSDIQYYDNDAYFIGTRSTTPIPLDSSSGAGVAITNNTINNVHSTDCITLTGNTCNQNYSGTPPTGRPAAGLQ